MIYFSGNMLIQEGMNTWEKILLKEKFLRNCTEKEEYFFKQLEEWIKEHSDGRERNKDSYWSLNEKVIKWIAQKTSIDKAVQIVSILIPFSVTTIVLNILDILKVKEEIWYFVIMVVVFIVALGIVISIWYKQVELKKTLQLKKYGETWVRHTVALANYEEEVLRYIYTLDDYEGKSEEEQRKLFMQNALKVCKKNMDKFEENMKSIEEVVE